MEGIQTISVGDSVIIRRGDVYKHVKIARGRTQRVGGGLHIPLEELIGHPFGSSFQVLSGKLQRVKPSLIEASGEEMLSKDEDGDNRQINDDSQSQKLDRDDIKVMKEQGESGQKIVEQLVQNSSTFQERSNFSKAKYLRKKSKKHIPHFVAEYPTARLICQLLVNEQYPKSMGLQVHTLGQILSWANIRSGANVLVFESTQSFLTGAIMERVGDEGHIVQLYPGAYPVRTLLEDFNYSDERKDRVLHGFSLEKMIYLEQIGDTVNPSAGAKNDKTVSEENELLLPVVTSSEHVDEERNVPLEPTTNSKPSVDGSATSTAVENGSIMNVDTSSEVKSEEHVEKTGTKRKMRNPKDNSDVAISPQLKRSREQKIREETKATELLKEKNFDSLVIASRYNPKDCLLTLMKYLPPSRPFVVYCQYKEPLMECYVHLRKLQVAIDLVLSTTWFRRIQALPMRSHPEVKSPGTAGYLLHGMTIEAPE